MKALLTALLFAVAVSAATINGISNQSISSVAGNIIVETTCDGSTDVHSTIQAALDNASAGTEVILPACSNAYYLGTTGLTMTNAGVSLVGLSAGDSGTAGGSVLKYAGSGDAITIGAYVTGTGIAYAAVRNLKIDMSSATGSATAIHVKQTRNTSVENVFVVGTNGSANPNTQTCLLLDGGNTAVASDFGTNPWIKNFNCTGDFLYGIRSKPADSTNVNTFTNGQFWGGYLINTSSSKLRPSFALTSCTSATPKVCTSTAAHGLSENQVVYITGTTGDTSINGSFWETHVVTSTTFTLIGTSATGTNTGGTAAVASVGIDLAVPDTFAGRIDSENWAVGLVVNGNSHGPLALRTEGNTLDWYVTSNADSTDIIGNDFNTHKNMGTNTQFAGSSISQLPNLYAYHGLIVTGDTGGSNAEIGFNQYNTWNNLTAVDAGIGRNAAGVMEINNGGLSTESGTLKDLKLANLTATGNILTTGLGFTTGNRMFVASDFSTASNTSLQNVTGLAVTLPASTALNVPMHCHLSYSIATAVVAVSFGVQASVAPTNIYANGELFTNAAAATGGTLATLSTTTATNIVTATPNAAGTVYGVELYLFVENPSTTANTINIMVKTSTAADVVTVKRGSFCEIQ